MFQYLNALLLANEKAVLPGFGSFSIQPVPNNPNAKTIVFNPWEITDDGILANIIARENAISQLSAQSKIQQFAESIKLELKVRGRILLPDLGVISLNDKEEMMYDPDLSLILQADSFGLDPLTNSANLPPINIPSPVSTNTPPPMQDFTQPPAPNPQLSDDSGQEEPENSSPNKILWIGAALLALILFGIWLSFNPDVLNSWQHKEAKTSKTAPYLENNSGENAKSADNADKKEMPVANTPVVKEHSPAKVASRKAKIEEEPNTDPESKRYYVVEGVYSMKSNALNSVKSLKAVGYPNACISGRKGALFVVAYEGYNTKADAAHALRSIQHDEDDDAWLFEKN